MNSESVEALHDITAKLKSEHEARLAWLSMHGKAEESPLQVSAAEAEQIFAQRIATHEAKLEELGWRRTIRVEPSRQVAAEEVA